MEFRCPKKDLLRALARTQGVADRKSSIPILSNIHLRTSNEKALHIAATDLYLSVTSEVSCSVSKEGSLAVPARPAFDIVKNLPDGEISCSLEGKRNLQIKSGKVRYKIASMAGDEFPPLPNPEGATFATFPASVLSELLVLTHYAMSGDDSRPHLAASLVEKKGNALRVAATDGHRLSKAERSVDAESGGNAEAEFSMLVPSKGIHEIKRLLDDKKDQEIEIASVAGNAFVRAQDVQLSVKLVDGASPPYDKVIPQQEGQRIVSGRHALIEALRRASLMSADKGSEVQLHLKPGSVNILGQNPELGEGSEELEIDYAGDEQVIGFNARYLLDVLSSLTHDEISLEVRGSSGPGVVRPVHGKDLDFVGVVMPMRT